MGYTAEELDKQISADPDFQKLSPDRQVEFAMHAYEAAGLGKAGQAGAGETLAPPQVGSADTHAIPLRNVAGMVGRMGISTAGAVEGGKRGALMGSRLGLPGTIIGGAIGAGIGGFTGDIAGQGYETMATGERMPIGQSLKEAAVTGGLSAGGEGLVRGGIAAYNKGVAGPLGNMITGRKSVTQEGLKDAEHADQIGVQLRPAEVSESPAAAAIETNVRRSLFAKGRFRSLDVKNEQALSQRMTDLVDGFFPAGKDMGQLERADRLQTIIQRGTIPEWKATERELYKNLDEASSFTKVDTTGPLQTARAMLSTLNQKAQPKAYAMMERIVDDLSQPGPVTGMKVSRGDVVTQPARESVERGTMPRDTGFSMPEQTQLRGGIPGGMAGQPQLRVTTRSEAPRQATQLDFMKAHEIRSNLLDISRGTDEVLPARYEALAKKFAGEVDGAMGSAANAVSPKVYQMWREANEFVKKGHELFDARTTQTLLKEHPEDVVKQSFHKGAERDAKRTMELLKTGNAFDSSEAVMLYRRTAMEKAIADASAGGYLDPHKLYNGFYGKTGVGREVMNATFDPQFLTELDKTLAVAKRMNMSNLSAGNPSGTAGAVVNWFETSMAINIPANFAKHVIKGEFGQAFSQSAIDIQQAGIYVLAQRDMAQLMNSKEGLRVLREGMEMPVTAQNAARITTQIFTHALGLRQERNKERPPQVPTRALTSPTQQEQLQ